MVRSKQERFIANFLASEGISFEYERKLFGRDGSFRYPDFTLFINGKRYYWEHWGMVDDKSYRKEIPRRIGWYRKHGYYDYLIHTWGGWDKNLRGQVLAELSKLKERRKREYKPVFDSKENWLDGWRFSVIAIATILLTLFFLSTLFNSRQIPNPVNRSEAPKAVLQKREPEKEVQAGKPIPEKKERKEIFYMGIKISQ